MIKALIFDIDGTLIDSNDFHARSWVKAFAAKGKKISFKRIRSHMGKGADQLMPEFLTKNEIKEFGKELAELRSDIFKCDYLAKVKPFPKVRALFKKIHAAGARIALASSANDDEVEKYKKIANISDLVEKSTSADDANKSKPSPDIFHAAMHLLKNPPRKSVLVVGDSPYDALAARKAKLPVIGVLCGGFPERQLRVAGCLAIYKDPADLLKHLDVIFKGEKESQAVG